MGDHKNTIIAIVLSLIVVVGWQYFVGYPQMQRQEQQAKRDGRFERGSAIPDEGGGGRRDPNSGRLTGSDRVAKTRILRAVDDG